MSGNETRCAVTPVRRLEAQLLARLGGDDGDRGPHAVAGAAAAIDELAAEVTRALDPAVLLEIATGELSLFVGEEKEEPCESPASPAAVLRWNVYCHLRRTAAAELAKPQEPRAAALARFDREGAACTTSTS